VTAFPTAQQVIDLHDSLSGAPLISRAKLEAAVLRPQASFDGVFLHQSIYKQASVLLHAICAAHAFLDGNKRTAWVSTLTFLELNGVAINYVDAATMSDYMVEVATHIQTEQDTAFWFAALDPANARLL
jgi:death-on-curing protein